MKTLRDKLQSELASVSLLEGRIRATPGLGETSANFVKDRAAEQTKNADRLFELWLTANETKEVMDQKKVDWIDEEKKKERELLAQRQKAAGKTKIKARLTKFVYVYESLDSARMDEQILLLKSIHTEKTVAYDKFKIEVTDQFRRLSATKAK